MEKFRLGRVRVILVYFDGMELPFMCSLHPARSDGPCVTLIITVFDYIIICVVEVVIVIESKMEFAVSIDSD